MAGDRDTIADSITATATADGGGVAALEAASTTVNVEDSGVNAPWHRASV